MKYKKQQPRPPEAMTVWRVSQEMGVDSKFLAHPIRTGQIKSWKKGNLTFIRLEDAKAYRADTARTSTLASQCKTAPVGETSGVYDSNTPMERLLTIERELFADYSAARKSQKMDSIRGASRAYSDVTAVITAAQKRAEYLKELKEEWFAEVSDTLIKWAEPLKSQIEGISRSLAQQCSPGDPALAEKVLADWAQKTLLSISSSISKPKETKETKETKEAVTKEEKD